MNSKEFDNQFQKHFDVDGKLGPVVPVIYTTGIFFGLFLVYKSTMDRTRLGKFLWGQYVVFGIGVTALNWNYLRNHYADKGN